MKRDNIYLMTNDLLKNYKDYKKIINRADIDLKFTKHFVELVDLALDAIKKDDYSLIIDMYYFENRTLEEIAEFYDVNVKTVRRHKEKLINKISKIVFSEKILERNIK